MGLFSRRRHDDPAPAFEDRSAPAPAEPQGTGPWDRDGAPEAPHGRVDLGSLRVPIVDGMQLRLESPRPGAEAVAVILVLGGSTLELRAFAAPRTAGVWDELRADIKEFSNFCEDIQYINAYSAKQSFVEDRATKEKWGYYVLTENLRTVLPYKPNVEFFSMDYIKNEEVAFWKIFFCAYKVDENGEEGIDKIGESIYDDFIKKLPTDKYKFIDASYIVVEPLNRDDIEKMLK